QNTEQKERSSADSGASDLLDGQVQQDRCAGEARAQADASEEVERPVPVAAHEDDRQQIEGAAQVALDPEARATVEPRPVVDRQLGDAEAKVMSENGNESMPFAVEAHVLEDFGAVCLQAAIHVVELHACRNSGRPVVDPGDESTDEGNLAVASAPR